jgi:hypothetical protein
MQTRESSPSPAALRHALATVEVAVAGSCIWSMGVDSLMAPHRGGHSIGPALAKMMAPVFMLFGFGLIYAAVKAWRGGHRWWVWQVALPVTAVGLPVAVIVVVGILNIIYFIFNR